MAIRSVCQAACSLALFLAGVGSCTAATFQISPVTASLSTGHRIAAFVVRNTSDKATTIQLRTVSWSQANGEDAFASTQEILATPPISTIPPGGRQIVRVGILHEQPDRTERAYRLFVREVPSAPTTGKTGLRVVLEMSLPIFVEPAVMGSPRLSWSATRPDDRHVRIQVRNEGTRHVHLAHVQLQAAHGQKLPISPDPAYVLPGSSHTWLVDAPVTMQALTLTATNDGSLLQAQMAIASQ
jgi:fimbrial chaperone protein